MCDHCGCRQYAPIADLTAEHETILALAWDVAEDPEREGAARLASRDRLLALLEVHVAKEEIGLYPELMASGDLSEETNDALEDEHREVRHALVTGSFDRRDYFALAAHVEQEEMELFSAAMFAFDEEVWDRLDAIHDGIALAPAH